MYYVFEAVIIGVYSLLIYLLLYFFINNITYLLFLTGVFKHFLGYLLNIQDYYCKYKYKYNKIKKNKNKIYQIIFESIIEGILFIIIWNIINNINKIYNIYDPLIIFFIGFILHIMSEILGVHTYFCQQNYN